MAQATQAKKEKKVDDVKNLIDLGKEKGFLTYEEVNDVLPPDVTSPEVIDDIMVLFSDMDIEILDNESAEKRAAKKKSESVSPGKKGRRRLVRSMIPRTGKPTTPCACTCARWGRSPC